jgi:hypothetical protein
MNRNYIISKELIKTTASGKFVQNSFGDRFETDFLHSAPQRGVIIPIWGGNAKAVILSHLNGPKINRFF